VPGKSAQPTVNAASRTVVQAGTLTKNVFMILTPMQ